MIVTFISQCEKNALKRTRRVLDAFASRIGDNVWQTAITEEGLKTVKKLLKATASRSTAVSCHRVRTRHRTELVWIVGRKQKFNEVGGVAVNRTKRNILHNEWENDWQYASSIQIIATLSALLHDIGKSTIGFQYKLKNTSKMGDSYRHEWISLKLFELIIADCNTDEAWLLRMLELNKWLSHHDLNKQLKSVDKDVCHIQDMPPLAQWVAWLIVTHHRLPPVKAVFYSYSAKEKLKKHPTSIKKSIDKFYGQLAPFDYWIKNPKTLDEATQKQLASFWQCDYMVIHSPSWQKQLKRWANKTLNDPSLQQLSKTASDNQQPISDIFLLYLSRLALVVGDHNYSSLSKEDKRTVKASCDWHDKLIANTDRKTGSTKQALDEHLLGVADFTKKFTRFLPTLSQSLPMLKEHDALAKNTTIDRFEWQNHAFKLARDVQKDSVENGFFGVNMASTGCGKTIGNARIMYGLAEQKRGARFTIALGLRVLTLQTGQSFRKDLKLNDEQLAILVGGSANKKLFEYNQETNNQQTRTDNSYNANNTSISFELASKEPAFGSESSTALVDEVVDSAIDSSDYANFDYNDYNELNIDTIINDHKARKLLFAPVVTCTLDHIIQASECKRGGGFVTPMLRLLTSDIILDEPDDFGQEDLPALCRLVHLAGVFGSRILLSSATLPPDMVSGLYQAYLAGRTIFNHSQNKPKPNVVCAWFDEQTKKTKAVQCADKDSFEQTHDKFTVKRRTFLAKQPIRRQGRVIDVSASYHSEHKSQFYQQMAQQLLDNAISLHETYHQKNEQTQLSIGLVRIANIKHIIPIAQQLLLNKLMVPDGCHVHIACYHSRQLLVLRNHVERHLDIILKRKEDNPTAIFSHKAVQSALAKSTAGKHIFIVLGSPVTEVGRDHDYDWAIVEPSSMRSIIQLAGRVWRHRPNKKIVNNQANILLMRHNFRYLTQKGSKQQVFTRPGFETDKFKPHSYDLAKLINPEELACIDARPRIIDSEKKIGNKNTSNDITSLAKLEHSVMQDTLNSNKLNYVNAYWSNTATGHKVNTHLQQLSPFRYQPIQEQDWMLIPEVNDIDKFTAYYAEDIYDNGLQEATPHNKDIRLYELKTAKDDMGNNRISPWLNSSLIDALQALQIHEPDLGLNALATRYSTVSLQQIDLKNSRYWQFHPFLGFWRE